MNIAGLCKGSTADSDSVCEGSNPSPAAIPVEEGQLSFLQGIIFYARVVELADSLDSGSSVHYARAGSSPASRTTKKGHLLLQVSFFCGLRGQWGLAENYDICLDSGRLGVDQCVDILVNAAKA